MLVSSQLQSLYARDWMNEEHFKVEIVMLCLSMLFVIQIMQRETKKKTHQVVGALSKIFLNNALQSQWTQNIWSIWAAPRDKQTVSYCLQLLFSKELIQTANSPGERKEIKCNAPNLYPGTDSFIFENLAASHANKKLLKDTEQGCTYSGSKVHSWHAEVVETLHLRDLGGHVGLSCAIMWESNLLLCLNLTCHNVSHLFSDWLSVWHDLFHLSFLHFSLFFKSHHQMFCDINIFFI